MRIAVDLDGVVYEWFRTYRYMVNRYRNRNLPPVEEWWTEYNADLRVVSREDRDWVWTEGVTKGLFRYGHMVKDARWGLEALHELGHEFTIVTHRPESAVPDTLSWLGYYLAGIPTRDVRFLSQQQTKTLVEADLLIDDKTENCLDWWKVNGGDSLLFDRVWNRSDDVRMHPHIIRVEGWEGVVDHVRGKNQPLYGSTAEAFRSLYD